MKRPTQHETWMDIACLISRRGTCPRRQVGCVIVDRDNFVLATGYNGVPSGMEHCAGGVGCPAARAESGKRLDECLAVHAEQNALLRMRDGKPHAIYTTTFPCIHCAKMIVAAGIQEVHYMEPYKDELSIDFLRELGMVIKRYI